MSSVPKHIHIIKITVLFFWVALLFLLVQKVHLIPEVDLTPEEELSDYETFMSIFFRNQKVGYTEQSLTRTEHGYIINQSTFMNLNLMGSIQELRTLTSAMVTEAMELMSFNFFMAAGPVKYQLSGRLNGLDLELTSMTGGQTSKSRLRLQEIPRLASGLMPYLIRTGLEKGRRFRLPVFDPSTLSTKPVVVEIEDQEILLIDGQEIETYRIRLDYRDTQSYTWVNTKGRTIKEEGLLGLSMVRTTKEKARTGLTGRASLTDVVAATSAPSSRSLKHPRDLKYLKARLLGLSLDGLAINGGRQRLEGNVVTVRSEKIDVTDEAVLPVRDPEFQEYLAATSFIQTRHPRIISKARQLTAGLKSPLAAIQKVTDWVFENLEKRPTMSVPSALDVLENRVGDCNEHAVLAAALLRVAGVPARVAVGVLYYNRRFYYHAWLEVYWGRWLAVDPLLGQIPADATHIRFAIGDLSEQADMIRVIGRLEVEILEAQ